MVSRQILGIDPGLDGALAFLTPHVGVEIYDMPTVKVGKGRSIDEGVLARILDARAKDIEYAVLEQQWARPTDGGPQGFKLGVGYGELRMLLASNFVPFVTVSPLRWKRAMGCLADKDAARALASQLLPRDAHQWLLKKHDGRAEAALIALYGQRHPVYAETAA
jgi:crossover junction endodeoxyribonuclease RuvC